MPSSAGRRQLAKAAFGPQRLFHSACPELVAGAGRLAAALRLRAAPCHENSLWRVRTTARSWAPSARDARLRRPFAVTV